MKMFLEIIKTPFYLIGIVVSGFICLTEILEEKEEKRYENPLVKKYELNRFI
jgi:hypothetical protein